MPALARAFRILSPDGQMRSILVVYRNDGSGMSARYIPSVVSLSSDLFSRERHHAYEDGAEEHQVSL